MTDTHPLSPELHTTPPQAEADPNLDCIQDPLVARYAADQEVELRLAVQDHAAERATANSPLAPQTLGQLITVWSGIQAESTALRYQDLKDRHSNEPSETRYGLIDQEMEAQRLTVRSDMLACLQRLATLGHAGIPGRHRLN
jgi:hypothetical protein